MPESDLLVTRFTVPPVRPGLMQRPQLLHLLEQSQLVALTLLSASAGFGKTTLLADWAGQQAGKVAWLSLDEQDNDPTRFWTYVVAALRKAGVSTSMATESFAQPALFTGALTSLINELAALEQAITLVLDDYHLIREQALHASLQFLLEHRPAHLHLILASRSDPAFPLARLRARGEVLELRESDLRLNQAETSLFLNKVMGLSLAEDEVVRLEERTEGWITGLQLAALALRRHSDAAAFLRTFTGSHRFILDYVQGEILEHLPEKQQRFLLAISILHRINAEISQLLTGEQASQQMLEDLERANLFLTPLDEERRWYRLHALFREVLLARLHATQAEQVRHLQKEAALWYQAQGWLHEAISHALNTRDHEFVARLLESSVERLARQGDLQTLLTWIKQLPLEVLQAHPGLATTYLLIFNLLFPFSQQEQEERVYLQQLYEGVEAVLANAQMSALEQERLYKRMSILMAWNQARQALSAGNMEELSRVGEEMQLPELDDDALWQQHGLAPFAMAWRMAGNFPPLVAAIQKIRRQARLTRDQAQEVHVLWGLIAAQIALGQLRAARNSCLEFQQMVQDLNVPLPLSAYIDLFQAQLAYASNRLEVAHKHAQQAIESTAPLQYMDILMGAYEVLVRTRMARADLRGAERAVEEMDQMYQSSGIALFRPWVEGLRVHLWLRQGTLARAAHWAEQTPYRREALTQGVFSREATYLALVQVYLAQADYQHALDLLAALLQSAEQVARMGSVIAILALQVATLQAAGSEQEAQQVLERLLLLAEAEGHVRVFLDAGPSMQEALTRWRATHADISAPALVIYVQTLLAVADDLPVKMPDTLSLPRASGSSPLLEPLTPREREVLLLLAEGMTNQDIAERLVVSLTTVKKHVASLFLKLAAENRTHAVARARELELF